MRFRHDIKKSKLKLDITPLIDVVFLLLIFFMLSSHFVYNTNIKVKLPKATTGKVNSENIMTITITEKSEYFLDDKYVEFSDLHKILREMENKRIAIVADKQAPFEAVIGVWDFARKYNLKEIDIRTVN